MDPTETDNVIRITKDEAMSSHVDDLLKRQMSLQGVPGVTKEREHNWYYQNWFVLALVGAFGALAAWALIEPVFDDLTYWQGPVTTVDPEETVPARLLEAAPSGQRRPALQGAVTVGGEHIYVSALLREMLADGTVRSSMSIEALRLGTQVGLYVDDVQGVPIAHYAVAAPGPATLPSGSTTLSGLLARSRAIGLVLFAIVAGGVGLFIGAADGIICRLPRRALLSGTIGLLVGLAGGVISSILAGIVYGPLNELAMRQATEGVLQLTTLGFGIQVVARALAWSLAGMAMGLGQGIALRSGRLLLYGFIGGVVGGMLGGLLFDPINMMLPGSDGPSAHLSRLVGFAVIGASVGCLIGIVELLARDAWLRMVQGPLAGKEFLVFKDVMNVGASPRSDIYLFNDPQVAEQHAVLRVVANECEIEAKDRDHPILVNNRTVQRARLRHGDTVSIGRTVFAFQRRKG